MQVNDTWTTILIDAQHLSRQYGYLSSWHAADRKAQAAALLPPSLRASAMRSAAHVHAWAASSRTWLWGAVVRVRVRSSGAWKLARGRRTSLQTHLKRATPLLRRLFLRAWVCTSGLACVAGTASG
jgi:hypothetical protein